MQRVLLNCTDYHHINGPGGGGEEPPKKIVLLIVRIIQNFQGIFVGLNEVEI